MVYLSKGGMLSWNEMVVIYNSPSDMWMLHCDYKALGCLLIISC